MTTASETTDPPQSPVRRTLAWGVHLFTASGAVVGVLALLCIAEGWFERAALLMMAAFFIDAVDGTLARRVRVADVLPGINGRRLDDIVDFLNFVIVPVVFMVWTGGVAGWIWAAPPILASAYGFSQEDAKTEDSFFLGWPSYWNVVAIYLWLLEISPGIGTAWVVFFSIAVFVPIKYVYPSRLLVLKRTTNLLGAVWGGLVVASVIFPEWGERAYLVEISLAYVIYYLVLSFWLGGLGRRQDPAGD